MDDAEIGLATRLLEEAERRYDAGDYAEGLPLAERAVALLRPGAGGSTRELLAFALRWHGKFLYERAGLEEARHCGEEAEAMHRSFLPSVPVAELARAAASAEADPVLRRRVAELGADLNLLGVLDLVAGRHDEARRRLEDSLALRTAGLGADHADTLESQNNLGVAMFRMGDRDGAIALHERVLAIAETRLGPDHRRTILARNAIAIKLAAREEDRTRARELYEQALASAERTLGPTHPIVAQLLNNVATARIDAGDVEAGTGLLEQSLQLHEERFGPESRLTANVLINLGDAYRHVGRLVEARPLLERGLAIRVGQLGAKHADTIAALRRIVLLLGQVGQHDPAAMADAIPLYRILTALDGQRPTEKLQAAGRAAGGASGPTTAPGRGADPAGSTPARGLGDLLGSALDPEAATRQLLVEIGRFARRPPPLAPEAQAAMDRSKGEREAADQAFMAGEYDEAAARLEASIALVEGVRGPVHPDLVEPLRRLQVIRAAQGRESDVLPLDERIVSILVDAYGEGHPHTLQAMTQLRVRLAREYGPRAATETDRRIVRALEDALGRDSSYTDRIRKTLDRLRALAQGAGPPAPVALSVRRETELGRTDPLANQLLAGIGTIDWHGLTTAYGRADDVPRELRLLLAADSAVRDDAIGRLASSICHQGTVYEATAPAVPFLLRLAGDARVPGRDGILGLLAFMAESTAPATGKEPEPDTSPSPVDPSLSTFEALRAGRSSVAALLLGEPNPAVRTQAAAFLDALSGRARRESGGPPKIRFDA